MNLCQKYIYPDDVCSNEEPILDDVIDPEEWTGFRVERKSADSNEARRLLGIDFRKKKLIFNLIIYFIFSSRQATLHNVPST